MAETLIQVSPRPREREALVRRAKQLAWGGNAWHFLEFLIAVGAGVVAGSVALIGFGIDSLIESLSAFVILWLFTGGRGSSMQAERRAQQLIAASYFILAAYIGVESLRDLAGGHEPKASWIGIGLAAITAPTMPVLARAKRRVGHKLNSSATVSAERARRLVVGGSGSCARHWRVRRPRRRRDLARRTLRLLLIRRPPATRQVRRGWSLYGAPWLQLAAIGGKSTPSRNPENKPNPLPLAATGCLRRW